MFERQSWETAYTIVVARFRQFHRALVVLSILAAFAGFTIVDRSVYGLNLFLLVPTFIALRFRFWLDDEAYFEDVEKDALPGGLPSRFAVPVALFSWVLWLLAGLLLPRVETAFVLLLIALIPPTCWMVAAMIERRAHTQQVERFCFNLAFWLGIFLIQSRAAAWNPFSHRAEGFTTFVLAVIWAILAIDLIARSKIFAQFQRRPEESSRLWPTE